MKKFALPVVILALIVIAAIYFYTSNNSQTANTLTPVPSIGSETNSSPSASNSSSIYKNGTYSVEGHYVSPGGPRDIGVTITLEGDTITNATFEGQATDPNSKRFQGEFADNFKELVIGKNIDEVELTKVAGSSLTPKGFNDALEQIKVQAQS